ncbi:MAG: alpha amylase C-terminal domain-containing protein, partial [Gammaproteobacteria bacterium]|nr:alpha amylase C-terminal domain-containing protein [Gammaproteobacteria bacterium]
DGGGLSNEERDLRDFYRRLLSFSASSKALTGDYAEIHSHNRATDNDPYNDRVFSFVRWKDDERLVVVSNFDAASSHSLEVRVPKSVIERWQLKDGGYMLDEQLYRRNHAQLLVDDGKGMIRITLGPLDSAVFKVGAPGS